MFSCSCAPIPLCSDGTRGGRCRSGSQKTNIPLDRIHTTLPSKSRFSVCKSSAKHDHRVINTAWVPMKYLFSNKRPFVHFVGDGWGKRTTALMREMDVPWITCPTGGAGTFGVRRWDDTLIYEENSRSHTRRESGG